MDAFALFALFSSAALNALAPGPCLLLIVARATTHGRAAGLAVTAGVVTAQMIYMTIAWVAVSLAVAFSAQAYSAVQLVGAALLVYLAVRLLTESTGNASPAPNGPTLNRPTLNSPTLYSPARIRLTRRNYLPGLLVGFSSPFNLIFMFGVLPQLIPATGVSLPEGALIVGTIFVGSALPMAIISLLASRLSGPGGRTAPWVGRLAGLVLLAYATLAIGSFVSALTKPADPRLPAIQQGQNAQGHRNLG